MRRYLMQASATTVALLSVLLPTLVAGYNVFISEIFRDGYQVFNASIGLQQCRYRLKDYQCQDYPVTFKINEDNGVILAWRDYGRSSSRRSINTCRFDAAVECPNIKLEVPIEVHLVPEKDWNFSPGLLWQNVAVKTVKLMNVSVLLHTNSAHDKVWLPVLNTQETGPALPASLNGCTVKVRFAEKHENLRIKKGVVHISADAADSATPVIATLSQSIRDCPIEGFTSPVIANDHIAINLDIRPAPTSMEDSVTDVTTDTVERSRRSVRRRRASDYLAFSPPVRVEKVSENRPPGTDVVTLTVINPSRLKVTYSWQAASDKRSLNMFDLNSHTGTVSTKVVLNREVMASHVFRVIAKAGGRTAELRLRINVIDMNDNAPLFERSSYRFRLRESEDVGAYFGEVRASDLDSGENARLTYMIEGLDPGDRTFLINNDGEVTLGRKLDRELKSQYSFRVAVSDNGTPPRKSTAQVTVIVEDVNDNDPRFVQPQYNVRISENTKRNTIITEVKARDSDAGENGHVTYTLLAGINKKYFSINRETGEISLISDVSFANNPEGFRFRVRAQDGGRPPRYSTCNVVVTLIDVNDNTPLFLNSLYVAVVSENLNLGSEVTRVKAVDPDSGDNARIAYSFAPPSANIPFRINNTSGEILLARHLDYERTKHYSLVVRASDHGIPPKSSTAKVEVTVRNINDNAPKFKPPSYSVRVSETMRVGQEVKRVTAIDDDEGTTLNYRIISGNNYDHFAIATRDNVGVITLARPLDFNHRNTYELLVWCSDGVHISKTTVRINVTDANTHVPEFTKSSYEVTVPEDIKVGGLITTVHAQDRDVGENARITYSLRDPDPPRSFSIDSKSGQIRTLVPLDYDTNSQIYLTVVAEDNGIPKHQDEAMVIIYLEDKNDNAPRFLQPNYSAKVSEDVRVGKSVTRISATDRDSGKNGEVFYTFEGGDDGNGYFKIDQATGNIRTALGLDREHVDHYDLKAYAVDKGRPQRRTPVDVSVTVLDVDDNPPQFPSDEITFEVPEDSPIGSAVATLHAVDPDMPEEGQAGVIYELAVDLDVIKKWDLNYLTGELSPTSALDYETQANYTLTVSAFSNQLVSQVKVHINLKDVNDNPPVLNDFQIIFNNYRTYKPYTFPFGPIGKIPAYDPDVTSQLRYKFLSGNNNSLLILNETTGEIRLTSNLDNDREFTTDFMVEVSDGKFRTTGKCTLKVVPITDEMLTNSVTVRVEDMSQENFLSNVMETFVHGLGQILNVSALDVFIFNVQNDTDVAPHAVVNVSFSARRTNGHFFNTQHLQEQVYLNRSLLTNYSMQNVMPFDDNICLREPCENYMRCVSALYFNSSAPFVSTKTVLFRPIHPVSGLRCKCPNGFAGQGCENEVNLCHPSKCRNNGRCVSIEGDYVCVCNGSFTGRHCEVNLVGSQCEDAVGICKNGARCQSYMAGGFSCECKQHQGLPAGDLTPFCELRGRSFRKGDFAMFSGITRQWRFTLSLSFATQEKAGLLLYNGRFNHEHDYLALEIVEGQVQVNFSTGQDFTVVSPYIAGGVNDGKWHTVEMEYHNKPKQEVLGRGHTGPSNIKVVTLTIDPESCDPALSTKWKSSLGSYTCSKTAEQSGTKSSLDLTTPLLIGGVPNLPEAYQVRARHFEGCIRDLHIDHRRVDMSNVVANHGSQPGCNALRDRCETNPCSPSGTCENAWGMYVCKCRDDHGGKRCERILPVHQFFGRGCLKHKQVSVLPAISLPWRHTCSFRTTQPTGAVLHMNINPSMEVQLFLREQRVTYSVRVGGKKYEEEVDAIANDGEWHEVSVEWKRVDGNVQIHIEFDNGLAQDAFEITNLLSRLAGSTSKVTELFVGGSSARRGTDDFNGCIRGVEFVSHGRVHVPEESSFVRTAGASVKKGCTARNACIPNPCPAHSECVTTFDTYMCKCHNGYFGRTCKPACQLGPCREGSQCAMNSSVSFGYTCQCSKPVYYGRTCHQEHMQPCPLGWHGYPVCMPCNCPVDRNFDPDCGKDGVCRCKENHYFNLEKDMCLPCNCYHVGSYSLACANKTGQCSCKPGVIGKQCNNCSSKFGEVTDKGCEVLYDVCPQSFIDGIVWRRASFGEKKLAQCPRGSVGIATRKCHEEKGWSSPVLSNCTSDAYHEMLPDLKFLANNPASLTEHRVRSSLGIALRLDEAANSTDKLYEGDVLMSYMVLNQLLGTQKSLSGFELTSAKDPKFNDYLVRSTSRALYREYIDHWRSLQSSKQSSSDGQVVNSARLLHSYEEYLSALTRNMLDIYYKKIVSDSDNVHLSIVTVSNGKSEDVHLRGAADDENNARLVMLRLPAVAANDGSAENATVGAVQFSTLGQILPMEFHDSRLDMRIPQKPYINSAVVSVVTHNRANKTLNRDDPLISLTFPLLQQGRSNPQCVFWNFTIRDGNMGGWSQKGCITKKSNKTHVECSCSHLTSFAVVTDEEIISVTEQTPVKVALYCGVIIVIACVIVCLGFSCCLEDVKSNHANIHNNFAVSVLLSEIFFVVGIMQTANSYVCMAMAIFIHFFFMTTFAWVFVEGLHLYRMMKEQRDVNQGNMRVYYLFGWGVPAIITALSVGLDAKGFGNAHFCWITTDHLLIWSFAGPLIFCMGVYLLLFAMTIVRYCTAKQTESKRSDTRARLRASFILLPVVAALWALALFAVNENQAVYYYLFSLVNVVLGALLLLLHCFMNKEVRDALRNVKDRRFQRSELNTTRQNLLKNSFSPATTNGPRRLNLTSASSTSTTATASRRNNHQDSSMFHDISDMDGSDDSDSDISNSSISLASTHSSDDEEVDEKPTYLNMNNSSNWAYKNGHLPVRRLNHDSGLVVHSTPKDKDEDRQQPSYSGSTSSRNDNYKSSLPTVSEAQGENDNHDGPHYLAINTRKDAAVKAKEEKIEMIPMQDMDSLPKRGILKNGRRSKPPTPVRVDSLMRKDTENEEYTPATDETNLLKSSRDSTLDRKRASPGPGLQTSQVL